MKCHAGMGETPITPYGRDDAVADAVRRFGTPHSPDPVMRRPRADREEERLTHGRGDCRRTEIGTGQPDPGDPRSARTPSDIVRSARAASRGPGRRRPDPPALHPGLRLL